MIVGLQVSVQDLGSGHVRVHERTGYDVELQDSTPTACMRDA